MNRFAIAALATLMLAGTAKAQVPNPLIVVDESGIGTIQFPGGPELPMPGVMAPDPGPGGLASALTFNLLGPPALVPGDLIISEPTSTNGLLSDIVRFNPAGTGGPAYPASLVFYSDNTDGADDKADTGFPTALYTNTLTMTEVGPEGNNGVTYTPTPNQPGFVPGFAVTYRIISDKSAIPEPGTLSLLSTLAIPGAFAFRRRRTA